MEGQSEGETRRPRVLWLSTVLAELDAGFDNKASRRELEAIRALAGSFSIRMFSTALPPGRIDAGQWDAFEAEGVSWLARGPRTRAGMALAAARPGPPVAARSAAGGHAAIRRAALRVLEEGGADLVHVAAGELAAVAATLRAGSVPILLHLEDLGSQRIREASRHAPDRLQRLRLRIDAGKARRWERRWYVRAGLVAAGSAAVASALSRDLGLKAEILPLDDPETLAQRWSSMAAPPQASRQRDGVPPSVPKSASVVVCTRERPEMLSQSLPAVAAAADHAGAELILVEQGAPLALDVLERLEIDAVLVRDEGTGAAHARNAGLDRATGEAVLFTDDDCIVPGGWVRDHVAALTGPVVASFGVVEGISRAEHGGPDPVARRALHGPGSPPWVIGHSSNMVVERSAALAIGGFDERLGPGTKGGYVCEDADLIVRLLRSGGLIASGVGEPVEHIDWRTPEGDRSNMRAYERGAGAWIGKLARQDPHAAWPPLRERLTMLNDRLHRSSTARRRSAALLDGAAFARGLARGVRLRPWRRGAA